MTKRMQLRFTAALKQPAPQGKTKSYLLSGKRIKDPFASLEETSEATKDWLEKQALLSRLRLLAMIANYKRPKEFYQAAFAQLHSVPFRAGPFYFYVSTDKSGFTNIKRALAISGNGSLAGPISKRAKIIFKAEKLGDSSSWLTGYRVNSSGDLLAYGLAKNGSDFETWRVRDLKNGKDLPDIIEEVPSGSISFHPRKRGLFYRRSIPITTNNNAEPNYTKGAAIYFHRLGDEQKKDKIVHNPGKVEWVDLYALKQSQHALISEWPAGKLHNRLVIKSLSSGKICPLFPRKVGYYSLLGEANGKIYIKTDHGATRGRVLALEFDYGHLRVKNTQEVIKESQYAMQDVRLLHDRIISSSIDHEGRARLLQFDLAGKQLSEIELPFEGTLSSLSTSFSDSNIFFSLENFAIPKTIYRHDLKSGSTMVLHEPNYSMAKRVVQRMVQVESKDGVMVPMNIAYLKGTKFNGKNPTILSVYGGFSIANLPHFSYQTATWLAMGGIWAQPYLRGGDELGAKWHSSATKELKQRTYDDTITSAEWLSSNQLAQGKKIAICGASNGGLTVGAVICQRPDLFGAAIADNGLFDMLKFSFHGLGWAWQSEYGSVEVESEFAALRAYSPYHQVAKLKVKTSDFPHLLINASAGDNRVVPWHSYKFAAACQQQGFDALLNVKWQEGHGWGRPDWSVRDNLAYLQWALKMS
jgi:prolyl oligopeptidase